MRILYVCTANQCRSPMAERLARSVGADAASAGTWAVSDRPMVPFAEIALSELGGDPADFVSRRLSSAMIDESDLILTMTRLHRDQVLELDPTALSKTFTLSEADRLARLDGVATVADLAAARPHSWPSPAEDIDDPVGRRLDVFRSTARQIQRINDYLISRIRG